MNEPVKDGWKSIESAPRDGSRILVYFEGKGPLTVTWESPHDDNEEWAIWCVDDDKHGPFALRGYREGDDKYWPPHRPSPAPRTGGRVK